MDKYELKVCLDEIDRLIAERRFAEAADIADTIDWTRVKGVHVICKISDLYKINKRYKDSRDLMEIAYERNPSGRKIIYSLCELELKLNNYIHALQLYNAFINAAPRDSDRFLLQYKLYKKQDVNVYEQIAVLEEFLQHDFRERWAYELAALYLRAGEEQRCIRQCDEIVAYFGDGRFVIRALELKKSMTPLTPQQEERLEILKSGGTIAPPEPMPEDKAGEEDAGETEDSGTQAGEVQEDTDSQEDLSEAASEAETTAEEKTGADSDSPAGGAQETEGVEDGSADTASAETQKIVIDARIAMPNAASGKIPRPAAAEQAADSYVEDAGEEEDGLDAAEPSATPEEYTDTLLNDVNMQETIARGMREISDYDNVLAQETNGQLAMVMEEEAAEETQVEGQLDLAQIMSEWEKIRRDSEQQRMAEARRRVLERSDAAKRELYGDDYAGNGAGAEPSSDSAGTAEKTGTTRSWKKEDVENGLRGR